MRKHKLKLIFLGFIFALASCTPGEAVLFHFGDQGDALYEQAKRVVQCESRWNPDAVSPTNDHGLFQINQIHRRAFEKETGQPWSAVYDPYWNAYFARLLYNQSGWGPWTCKP